MYISETEGYGSHLPALRWAVENTDGPIFEMGAGLYSTPYLVSVERPLVTYELDDEWGDHVRDIVGVHDWHDWTTVRPWDHFSLAFLDGGTDETWLTDRREMFDAIDADLILIHDLAPHLFCESDRPWHGADGRFEHSAWYTPEGHPATWLTGKEEITWKEV